MVVLPAGRRANVSVKFDNVSGALEFFRITRIEEEPTMSKAFCVLVKRKNKI